MISFSLWYFGWLKNYRRSKRLLRKPEGESYYGAMARLDEADEANMTAMMFVLPLAVTGWIDGAIIAELICWIWL